MDPQNDGVSIWVGGKVSNARTPPMFSRLAIPYLPNNPPRWPEVTAAVKNLVEVWAKNAKEGERMGEWIERIGWERFFKLTGIEFTEKHLDNFTHATTTFRSTTQFKFPIAAGDRCCFLSVNFCPILPWWFSLSASAGG